MAYEKNYWEFGTNAKASRVKVHSVPLNAGNIAAQETLRAAFEAAVDAVSIGNSGGERFIATEVSVAKSPSLNPLAQRENRWLVSMVESGSGNAVTFTIPCADLSLLAADGDSMDTTSTEYADLVSAVEDFVRSNDGNTVAVSTVTFRGRTL